jgi:uncharacterized protein
MVELPASAAWRHVEVRTGFEVVFLRRERRGYRFEGHAAVVEGGKAWGIYYALTLDGSWATRSAHIVGRSELGRHEVRLEGDGIGGWRVNGGPVPELAGCLDVDLEASAFTNAFPVHRIGLHVGERADAPAAWVRALGLGVERLEQHYTRLEDDGEHARYGYAAPGLDFNCTLVYDEQGLVLDYPGLAIRVA